MKQEKRERDTLQNAAPTHLEGSRENSEEERRKKWEDRKLNAGMISREDLKQNFRTISSDAMIRNSHKLSIIIKNNNNHF